MDIQGNAISVKMPRWSSPLFKPMRYKAAYGGRGGGKTKNFALALIILAAQSGIRVMCGREFQNSIEESVKPALEWAIKELGYGSMFSFVNNQLICWKTGARFMFKGLARNIMSIKGWEDVDICWIEEAHTLSHKSLELLLPTMRKPGSEVWFSFNRHSRLDAVDNMFCDGREPSNAVLMKVNYYDNPFFPKEMDEERLRCLEREPDRYSHIWEGEPDDDSGSKVVLPLPMLLKAVDVHIDMGLDITGRVHSGLDVYDGGKDANAYAARRGPFLELIHEWTQPAGFLYKTVDEAHKLNQELNASRMYYDVGGIGAAVRSELNRLPERAYKAQAFNFGGKVKGPDVVYTKGIKNKDMFARQNAQAAWNLRLRLQNTMDFIEGKDVSMDKCLFINGKIHNINKLISELSQPTYDEDSSGRVKIDKDPDKKGSPNMYDATIMAFAWDIRRGLRVK